MGVKYHIDYNIGGSRGDEKASAYRLVQTISPWLNNNVYGTSWGDFKTRSFDVIDDWIAQKYPNERRHYIYEPFGFYGSAFARRDFFGKQEARRWGLDWLVDGAFETFRAMAEKSGVILGMHVGALQPEFYHFCRVDQVEGATGEFPHSGTVRFEPYPERLQALDANNGTNLFRQELLNQIEEFASVPDLWLTFDGLRQSQNTADTIGYAVAAVYNILQPNALSGVEGPQHLSDTHLHGWTGHCNSQLNFFRHFRDQLDTHPDPRTPDTGGDLAFNKVYGDTTLAGNWGLQVDFSNAFGPLENPEVEGDLTYETPADPKDLYVDGSLVVTDLPGKLVYGMDWLTQTSRSLKQIVDYAHEDAEISLPIPHKVAMTCIYYGMTPDEYLALAS